MRYIIMKEHKRFFGLHFDFHAGNDVEIGGNTTAEDIERYILECKPDFIQCDCKGHAGNSSYPTKVPAAKPADKIVADNMRVWSDVAKKHGIPLYVHYSGVWDGEYAKRNLDKIAVQPDNDGNPRFVSLHGDYVHEVLIAQMKELIDEYGISGVWVDGDCWAAYADFSENAPVPLSKDMSRRELNEHTSKAFYKYVQTYADELHAYAPDFKVISNWLYTSYTPDKPTVPIDFISGDFPHNNSVHEARYEGRAIALRGIPWDLMAWGFEWIHRSHKSSVQLMQEAATIVCLGGGFQIYENQNPDGSAKRACYGRYAPVGEFMRKREFLYGLQPTAQVGILFDGESYYHDSYVFCASGVTRPIIGAVNAVLDAQYTANIFYDYQTEQFEKHDIIVVPEWKYIKDETKEALLAYTKNGGKLIIMGIEACQQFGELIGVSFGETKGFKSVYLHGENDYFATVNDTNSNEDYPVLDLVTGEEGIYSNCDTRYKEVPAYRVEAYGEGKVVFVPFAYGTTYFDYRSFTSRDYLKNIMQSLSAPLVKINRKYIDITMQPSEKGVYLNLVNMLQGRHALTYGTFDEIPEIYNVEIRYGKKCKEVNMPLGENFTYEITENETIVRLEKLEIHSVIEFIE